MGIEANHLDSSGKMSTNKKWPKLKKQEAKKSN